MASARLNIFENFPADNVNWAPRIASNTLQLHGIYIPGSISFNNVAVIQSISATTTKSDSFYFGLYSLNGATLSLANSASGSLSINNASAISFITLVTSATQDITPGYWWFADRGVGGGAGTRSYLVNSIAGIVADGVIGGPFIRGRYTVSTTGFPASIATSDLNAEGDTSFSYFTQYPYILISA